MALLYLAADPPAQAAGDARLITVAIIGVALIVALITWLKVHPFLTLTAVSIGVALAAGLPLASSTTSFAKGFGDTSAGVGVLIGLGAMFGKLLADSGGADQVVDTIVGRSSTRALPWAMALVGAIIGLPMFFEIGLVLLIPVIILVARRSGLPLFRIAIPTLAGLSVMHGLVPPHPGPLVAVNALKANLGLTLSLGVLVAIPTVIIAGPVFSKFAARWVDVPVPDLYVTDEDRTGRDRRGDGGTPHGSLGPHDGGPTRGGGSSGDVVQPGEPATASPARLATQTAARTEVSPQPATAARADAVVTRPRPTFAAALVAILIPVVLMVGKSITDVAFNKSTGRWHNFFDFIGTPTIALALAVIAGIAILGRGGQMSRDAVAGSLEQSLPPVASIILIVGAGGGFKQVLIDTGIAQVIADAVQGSKLSPLLLAWIVAVLVRVATGSATVATVTTAGILAPVAGTLSTSHLSLMVLAIGSGSLFLSHVNDAGFWLVKQYMGTTVLQNFKTWSLMECIISVCGLAGVLALSAVI